MRQILVALVGLCAALLSTTSAQSIIAVDPGVNFMKIVLVQPGKVFDIALSPDSKRKTYTGVAILDGVRSFGSESFNVYGKKPQHTVWRVRDMLGRSPNDPELLRTLKKHHLTQQQLHEAADGTGAIRIDFAKGSKDHSLYSPEELFAMILTHCKENGERHGLTKVSALSLTTPVFFNQLRRQGLVDAAEISGLSLLGLVDENTAAAIQYAVDRSFNDTATNMLVFNMGASSTQVTIVQITGGKEKRSGKEFRNVRVIAKAWDEHLGAEDFDLALAAQFAKEFDEKHPSSDSKISEAPRAIVRLKKEARAIKEILSGLEKFPASFQSLHRDIDFKSHVTRSQLEDLAKDSLSRVTAPVERALKAAGMTVKDLHLVEVVGGGFRIPGIRNVLRQIIPENVMDLSTHVNGDEGMVFGAAFCAANVSSTFHVPRIATVQEALPREIRLQLKDGSELDRDVLLLPRFSLIEGKEPIRQVIKFRHNKDFKVILAEKKAIGDDAEEVPDLLPIMEFEVSGMPGALEAFGKYGEPKVHLAFTVDRSLMLNLQSAEARFDEEYEEQVKSTANASATEDTNSTTVKKTRKHVFSLTVKRTDNSVPVKRMTAETKIKAQEVLKTMDEADKARARRDEARNGLEAFSFVSREKLDTAENAVKDVLESSALESLVDELRKVEDWIDDHRQATAEEFLLEKARLQAKVDKVFSLIREHKERPGAIKALKGLVRTLEDRRGNWTEERPWIPAKVWEVVDKAQSDALKWADEMEAKQSKLTPREDPVLSLSLIRVEMEKLQKMVELLLKQRRPPPVTTTAKSTSSKGKGEKTETTKEGEKTTTTTDEEGASAGGESTEGEGEGEGEVKQEEAAKQEGAESTKEEL